MRRVSSRQRLFSWDQFDATAECSSTSDEESDYITCLGASSRNTSFAIDNDDDDDNDYYNDKDTIIEMKLMEANKSNNVGTQIFLRNLSYPPVVTPADILSRAIETDTPPAIKRTNANGTTIKKSVSFSNLVIANKNEAVHGSINPSPRSSVKKYHYNTTATTSTPPSSALMLLDLNCDTQIDVISFLTAEEVQCIGMTCHYFNDMLLVIRSSLSPQEQVSSVARNTIWWSLMRDRWPHLPILSNSADNEGCGDGMIDDTANTLPSAQVIFTDNCRNSTTANVSLETMNFGALLKQAPTEMPPSQIDSQFYVTSSSLSLSVSTAARTPTLPSNPSTTTDTAIPPSAEAVAAIRKQAFISYEMKTPCFSEKRLSSPRTNGDDNDDSDGKKSQQPHQQQGQQEQQQQIRGLEVTVRVVQFTGTVGAGDRSIRADRPFPRPLESISVFKPLVPRYEHEDDDEIISLSNGNNNTDGRSSDSVTVGFNNFGSRAAGKRRKRKERKTVPRSSNVVVPSPRQAFLEMLERGRKCHARYLIAVAAATQAIHEANSTMMRNNEGESSHINATTTKTVADKTRSIPFVSPFIVTNLAVGGEYGNLKKTAEIDMTPRMVAYFEVSILLRDRVQEPDMSEIGQSTTATTTPTMLPRHHDEQPILGQPQLNDQLPQPRQHASECIAVGLSVQSSTSRMPGWDRSSYGYHGDDGGIFHSRGEMIRVYGPKYGEGDTVGCGVNYENGGIFYTLNGNFLGYAWCGLRLVQEGKLDLYPTIGVDSNCPLVTNFGNARPFMFDLSSFVASKGSVPTRSI